MFGVGEAISIFGAIMGAQSARRQAALEQQQRETEAKWALIRGQERHNAALREMQVTLSANSAIEGLMSGNNDSLEAIRKRIKADTGADIKRLDRSASSEAAQQRFAGKIALEKGRNRAMASLIGGIGDAYSSYKRNQTVTPK